MTSSEMLAAAKTGEDLQGEYNFAGQVATLEITPFHNVWNVSLRLSDEVLTLGAFVAKHDKKGEGEWKQVAS